MAYMYNVFGGTLNPCSVYLSIYLSIYLPESPKTLAEVEVFETVNQNLHFAV